jgi:integrase
MVVLVEQYLAHRRSLGYAMRIEGAQLLSFARFADENGHRGRLTTKLLVQWATLPSVRPRLFPARRLDIVRRFAGYRAAFDPATEVPPRGLLGAAHRRPVHHIYSAAELAALIAAAGKLTPNQGLRPATYVTLFGLLAASGLRVSEALGLTRVDVDLEIGVLTIRATKFRKSRLVPLHPTTTHALRVYAQRRDQAVPRTVAQNFFTSAQGAALPYRTVRTTFHRLRTQLQWDALNPRPRIHDLRHTFACRRLEQWYTEGVDIAARIATLSTYLGHVKVSDTYWYLTGTPELLALAAERFQTLENTLEVSRDQR